MKPMYAMIFSLAFSTGIAWSGEKLSNLLDNIKQVGREGTGNAKAGKAWHEISKLDAASLPLILAGMDGANANVCNWLRTAVDAICERTVNAGKSLPGDKLEEFVRETKHSSSGR